ncbi:MAG: hypothetical protein QG594_2068 [Bacteroidota bacterium]|nr:hypothetical protein [Bacteroidota bacterium]
MNFPLSVTDNEIDELKSQLAEQKKVLEYDRLKKTYPILPLRLHTN